MMVRDRVCALLLLVLLSACEDKSKPDFEAEAERLKAYVVGAAPKEAHKLEADFDGKVKLVGYEVSPNKPLQAGQRVTLTLYWQSNKPVEAGYRLFTHVLDASGERIESLDEEGPLRELRDGRPALPPEAWKAGKVYVDELRFRVPKHVKTDKIEIVAGVARKDERLNVIAGEKDGAGAAKIVTLAVGPAAVPEREKRNTVKAAKLPQKQKITIDGKLEEDAWKSAVVLKLGNPKAKGAEPAKITASARLLWSDTGFYAGFDVADADVVKEGDGGGKAEFALNPFDAVEMLIDPEGEDNKDYYDIQIGASNRVYDTRFDSFKSPGPGRKGDPVPDGTWGHESWSSNAKSAVVVRGTLGKAGEKGEDKDEGYVVEVFVPWKSLSTTGERGAPKPGDLWRINLHAFENDAAVAWSPVNGLSFHNVGRFGRVVWADEPSAAAPSPSASAGAPGKPLKGDAPAAPVASGAKPPAAPKAAPAAPPPKPPAAVAPAASK